MRTLLTVQVGGAGVDIKLEKPHDLGLLKFDVQFSNEMSI
ncbi:hypothetical protein BH11ACT6_BH11ACT6_09040 [soil metagenome]